MEKVIKRNEDRIIPPKMFRRFERSIRKARRGYEFTNKRMPVNSSLFNVIGISAWGAQAIYLPKRKKLKGWQKNRKAA
jgi:hypothetical protein